MNITDAKYIKDYKVDQNTGVTATVDGVPMGIPLDPTNRHYAEVLRQLEAGELTIAEAYIPPPEPADAD